MVRPSGRSLRRTGLGASHTTGGGEGGHRAGRLGHGSAVMSVLADRESHRTIPPFKPVGKILVAKALAIIDRACRKA